MYFFLLWFVSLQAGVDAGPAIASCGQFPVTLTATPLSPPAEYEITWDGAMEPFIHFVVQPVQTQSYRVVMRDIVTSEEFEDTTWVRVHAQDPDINGDGFHNQMDFLHFVGHWPNVQSDPGIDADQDGVLTILDSFYLCDHDSNPPNTPPSLSVDPVLAYRNNAEEISFLLTDQEQSNLFILIHSQPAHGTALLINQHLFYSPQVGFTGSDYFEIVGFDGQFESPVRGVEVEVDVILYADVFQNIFSPICGPCHIDDVEGGLSLANYPSTLAGGNSILPGITPGTLWDSYIWIRVSGETMPPSPIPPISQELKDLLQIWIETGAPEF